MPLNDQLEDENRLGGGAPSMFAGRGTRKPVGENISDFSQRGYKVNDLPAGNPARVRREADRAKATKTANMAKLEDQFRQKGIDFYKGEDGILRPNRDEAGGVVYKTGDWKKTKREDGSWALGRRSTSGKTEHKAVPMVRGADAEDPNLYYDFGESGQENAGHVDDLIGSKNPDVAISARKARKAWRGDAQKAALAPLNRQIMLLDQEKETSDVKIADAQGRISQLGAERMALGEQEQELKAQGKWSDGGMFSRGLSPEAKRLQAQVEKIDSESTEITSGIGELESAWSTGAVGIGASAARMEALKSERDVWVAESKLEDYADLRGERLAVLKKLGRSAKDDPILKEIDRIQQDYGFKVADTVIANGRAAEVAGVPESFEAPVKQGKPAAQPEKDPTFTGEVGRRAGDLVASFGRGSNALLKMAGDLYGLTTGNMDNVVSEFGDHGMDYWGAKVSAGLKKGEAERKDAIDSVDGWFGKALAYVKSTVASPELFTNALAEQLPNLAGAGGAAALTGKAATKLLLKTAAGKASKRLAAAVAVGSQVGVGAALQGGDVGGDGYDEAVVALHEMSDEAAMGLPEIAAAVESGESIEDAKLALALSIGRRSGAIAFGVSMLAQGVPQMIPGLGTLEKVLAGKAGAAGVAGRLAGAGVTAATEALSEAAEEGLGRVGLNSQVQRIDPDRKLSEGVGEAVGQAVVVGGGLGGGGALIAAGPKTEAGIAVESAPVNRAKVLSMIDDPGSRAAIELVGGADKVKAFLAEYDAAGGQDETAAQELAKLSGWLEVNRQAVDQVEAMQDFDPQFDPESDPVQVETETAKLKDSNRDAARGLLRIANGLNVNQLPEAEQAALTVVGERIGTEMVKDEEGFQVITDKARAWMIEGVSSAESLMPRTEAEVSQLIARAKEQGTQSEQAAQPEVSEKSTETAVPRETQKVEAIPPGQFLEAVNRVSKGGTPEQKLTVARRAAENVNKALGTLGATFPSMRVVQEELGSGGLAVDSDGTLLVSIGDIVAEGNDQAILDPDRMVALAVEEGAHIISQRMEEAGRWNATEAWDSLSSQERYTFKRIYEPGASGPVSDRAMAHEAVRMLVQGRMQVRQDGRLVINGQLSEERASEKLISFIRDALTALRSWIMDSATGDSEGMGDMKLIADEIGAQLEQINGTDSVLYGRYQERDGNGNPDQGAGSTPSDPGETAPVSSDTTSAEAGDTATAAPDTTSQSPDNREPDSLGVSDQDSGLAAAEPSNSEALTGEKVNRLWSAFAADSGTLGIPRSDMPQVKAENRGALVQFLKARGIESAEDNILPGSLKPTQAEFSPAKVKKAEGFKGGDRAILVSSDGHVVDGHHQWLSKVNVSPDETIRVIRLDAPIEAVLAGVKEFPSSDTEGGARSVEAAGDQSFGGAAEGATGPRAQLTTDANGSLDVASVAALAGELGVSPEQIGRLEKVTHKGKNFWTVNVLSGADQFPSSHTPDGIVRNGYPDALQPRDRAGDIYVSQQRQIAANPNMDEEMLAGTTAQGLPIVAFVSGQAVTVMGNGRANGKSLMYDDSSLSDVAGKFQEDLGAVARSKGISAEVVDLVENPVLVRVAITSMPVEDLREASEDSNQFAGAATNTVEQARQDSDRLSPEVISFYNPDFDISAGRNLPFRQEFVSSVIKDTSANISDTDLNRRIEAAMFAKAYSGSPEGAAAFGRLVNEDDAGVRGLIGAMMKVAPKVAAMNTAIEDGALHPIGISADIARAVQDIAQTLRDKPSSQSVEAALDALVNQQELGAISERSELQEAMLQWLVENRRKGGKIAEVLNNYVTLVYGQGDPKQEAMFAIEPATPAQIWKQATEMGADEILASARSLSARRIGAVLKSGRSEQTETPAFKRWFGKSSVVDANGAPRVVYHGTGADENFSVFRSGDGFGMHFGTAGQATDRLDSVISSGRIREKGTRVLPVYLNIKNPVRLEDYGSWDLDSGLEDQLDRLFGDKTVRAFGVKTEADVIRFLKGEGHDGVVYKNEGESGGAGVTRKALVDAKEKVAELMGKKVPFYYVPDEVQATQEFKDLEDAQTAHRRFLMGNQEDSFIAFDQTQIKSAIGNRGTFDANDPSILKSGRSEQTETPAFKRWFGKSKVVDANGAPIVVYHGTGADFEVFDTVRSEMERIHGHPSRVMGSFFTNRENVANQYAKTSSGVKRGDARTVAAFLRVENPKRFELHEFYVRYDGFKNNDWKAKERLAKADVAKFQAEGYDGIIVDGGYEIIVFSSNQIKSATGNNGNFDVNNPSIIKSGRSGSDDTLDFFGQLGLNDEAKIYADNLPPAVANSAGGVLSLMAKEIPEMRGHSGAIAAAKSIAERAKSPTKASENDKLENVAEDAKTEENPETEASAVRAVPVPTQDKVRKHELRFGSDVDLAPEQLFEKYRPAAERMAATRFNNTPGVGLEDLMQQARLLLWEAASGVSAFTQKEGNKKFADYGVGKEGTARSFWQFAGNLMRRRLSTMFATNVKRVSLEVSTDAGAGGASGESFSSDDSNDGGGGTILDTLESGSDVATEVGEQERQTTAAQIVNEALAIMDYKRATALRVYMKDGQLSDVQEALGLNSVQSAHYNLQIAMKQLRKILDGRGVSADILRSGKASYPPVPDDLLRLSDRAAWERQVLQWAKEVPDVVAFQAGGRPNNALFTSRNSREGEHPWRVTWILFEGSDDKKVGSSMRAVNHVHFPKREEAFGYALSLGTPDPDLLFSGRSVPRNPLGQQIEAEQLRVAAGTDLTRGVKSTDEDVVSKDKGRKRTQSFGDPFDGSSAEVAAEASRVASGSTSAVRDAGRQTPSETQKVKNRQSDALRKWAQENGAMIDSDQFEKQWKEGGEVGGEEHQVIMGTDGLTVTKRNFVDDSFGGATVLPFHLGYDEFFDRVQIHNLLFEETGPRLLGFTETSEGLIAPVLSQAYVIVRRGATRAETEEAMELEGFRRINADNYRRGEVLVEDLHDENVVIDNFGKIQFIDPVIYIRPEKLKSGRSELFDKDEMEGKGDNVVVPEVTPVQKAKLKNTLLFPFLGNKSAISGKLAGVILSGAEGVNLVGDMMAGAGFYGNVLNRLGYRGVAKVHNEWNGLRAATFAAIKSDVEGVIKAQERWVDVFDQLDAETSADGRPENERLQELVRKIDAAAREVLIPLLPENASQLVKTAPIAMPQTAEVAGLYLALQNITDLGKPVELEFAKKDGSLKPLITKRGVRAQYRKGETYANLLRQYSQNMAETQVEQGDGYEKLADRAGPDTFFMLDPGYSGDSSNYATPLEAQTSREAFQGLINGPVFDAWKKGAKLLITNNWDGGTVLQLRRLGFTVLKETRGSGALELVAFNYDPQSGQLYDLEGKTRQEVEGRSVAEVEPVSDEGRVSGEEPAAERRGERNPKQQTAQPVADRSSETPRQDAPESKTKRSGSERVETNSSRESVDDQAAVTEGLAALRRRVPSSVKEIVANQNFEQNGRKIQGRPDLANPAEDSESRSVVDAVDEAMKPGRERETVEMWDKAAQERLDKDRVGYVRELIDRANDGRGFDDPVQTRAAQMIVNDLVQDAVSSGDAQKMKDAQAVVLAYRVTGTEQGRALAARRDPHKTPEERFSEFIASSLFLPKASVRKNLSDSWSASAKAREVDRLRNKIADLEAAKLGTVVGAPGTPGQDKTLANMRLKLGEAMQRSSQQEIAKKAVDGRMAKVEAAFRKMGITLDHIFNGEAYLKLRGNKLVDSAMNKAGYDAKKKRVVGLIRRGWSDSDVARRTDQNVSAVVKVRSEIIAATRARLETLGDAALDPDKLDAATLGSARADLKSGTSGGLSAAERQKRIDLMLSRMGLIENKEAVIRTEKAQAKRRRRSNAKPKRKATPFPANAKPGSVEFPAGADGQRPDDFGNTQLGLGEDADMAPPVFDISDPAQVAQVARTIQIADSGAFDMLFEFWINSILSGPLTQGANFVGNSFNTVWDMGVKRMGEAILNAAVKDPTAPQLGEFKWMLKGMNKSLAGAWAAAVNTWATEQNIYTSSILNSQLEINPVFDKAGGIKAAIPGKTGRVVRLPGRLLMATDAFFKAAIARTHVAAEAYRLGKSSKKKGAALVSFIEAEIDTPGSESWRKALLLANELTFQDDHDGTRMGKWMTYLSKARELEVPGGIKPLRFVMPFIRTPWNIFQQGIRQSPVGAVAFAARIGSAGLYRIKDGRPVAVSYPTPLLIKHTVEQVLAWSMAGLLYGAAAGDDDDEDKQFLITGSLPSDRISQRNLDRRVGLAPYAIRFGGAQVSYSRIEPLATMLGLGVDMLSRLKSGESGFESFGAFMSALGDSVDSKTFLRGWSDLAGAMSGESRFTSFVASQLSTLIPNLFRQPVRQLDGVYREREHGLFAEVVQNVYGPAGSPKIDPYGEEVERRGGSLWRMLVPIEVGKIPELNRVDQLLLNYRQTADDPQSWAPSNLQKSITVNGERRTLSGKVLEEYSRRSGKMAARLLQSVSLNVSRPTSQDVEKIRRAFTLARANVRRDMFFGTSADRFADQN